MITRTLPADGVSTTVSNAIPYMFTPIRVPGMVLENNGTEWTMRDKLVIDRRRVRFPNWRAARNFAILRTFAATCEKNGISAYQAHQQDGARPPRDIFTDGIPPPISGGGAAPTDERAASAEPA